MGARRGPEQRDADRRSVAPHPSLFITILAWLGIAVGILGCVGAVLVIFAHQQGWAPLRFLLASPLALVAAIGLRNRRNWARWSYIAVLGAGIANFAVRFVLHGGRGPALVIVMFGVLLNGLLITKLCSRAVRAEFSAAASSGSADSGSSSRTAR